MFTDTKKNLFTTAKELFESGKNQEFLGNDRKKNKENDKAKAHYLDAIDWYSKAFNFTWQPNAANKLKILSTYLENVKPFNQEIGFAPDDYNKTLNEGLFYLSGIDKDHLNPNNGVDLVAAAANRGSVAAQLIMAQYHHQSANKFNDKNKYYQCAWGYINQALTQDYRSAYTLAARFYENGFGVEINANKAMELYLKAEEKGCINAKFFLGLCFREGIGVEKDLSKSKDYIQSAADRGHAQAQRVLGMYYKNGKAVPKDLPKAAELFQLAAEQGDADAQWNLGYCYEYGVGVNQNYQLARFWYENSVAQNNAEAQFRLGLMYENEKDMQKAINYYRLAADQKHRNAQYKFAICFHQGQGTEPDLDFAVYYYQLSAEQGNVDAKLALADLYADVDSGFCNLLEAEKLYQEKIAVTEDAEVFVKLAKLYDNPIFPNYNENKSIDYTERAARLGHQASQQYLDSIKGNLGKAAYWLANNENKGNGAAIEIQEFNKKNKELESIDELIKRGEFFEKENNFEAAIKCYAEALEYFSPSAAKKFTLKLLENFKINPSNQIPNLDEPPGLMTYTPDFYQDCKLISNYPSTDANQDVARAHFFLGCINLYFANKYPEHSKKYLQKSLDNFNYAKDYISAFSLKAIGYIFKYRAIQVEMDEGILNKALNYFTNAAHQGDADAMYEMGILWMYAFQNPQEAVGYFRKAAQKNHVEAIRVLSFDHIWNEANLDNEAESYRQELNKIKKKLSLNKRIESLIVENARDNSELIKSIFAKAQSEPLHQSNAVPSNQQKPPIAKQLFAENSQSPNKVSFAVENFKSAVEKNFDAAKQCFNEIMKNLNKAERFELEKQLGDSLTAAMWLEIVAENQHDNLEICSNALLKASEIYNQNNIEEKAVDCLMRIQNLSAQHEQGAQSIYNPEEKNDPIYQYEMGMGHINLNLQTAMEWFQKAAIQGHDKALQKLIFCLENADIKKNLEIKQLRKQAEDCYLQANREDAKGNWRQAMIGYFLAFALGEDKDADEQLNISRFANIIDRDQIDKIITEVAIEPNQNADKIQECLLEGLWKLAASNLAEFDPDRGFKLIAFAANQEHLAAKYLIKRFYCQLGYFFEINQDESDMLKTVKFYKFAADLGDQSAEEKLREIYIKLSIQFNPEVTPHENLNLKNLCDEVEKLAEIAENYQKAMKEPIAHIRAYRMLTFFSNSSNERILIMQGSEGQKKQSDNFQMR